MKNNDWVSIKGTNYSGLILRMSAKHAFVKVNGLNTLQKVLLSKLEKF